MIKKLCRFILREEINTLKRDLDSSKQLAKRIAIKYMPYSKRPAGNNQIDETEAINDQIDICSALDVPLKLNAGVYKIESPIEINGNCVIEGSKEK